MDVKKYKTNLLAQLYSPYKNCTGCHFNMPQATQIVLGEGNPDSDILFIGEAPGADEDLQGRPFVGRSGKLLTKIIQAAESKRENVYITNIVKIRPPNNRKPLLSEIEISKPLLLAQIKIIRPKVICTLGASALEGLLGHSVKITQSRGKILKWQGICLLPAYHPAYILRNQRQLPTLLEDITQAIKLAS